MDRNNLRNLTPFVKEDKENKISLMMSHCKENKDVADPWYTGDFEATWQDLFKACTSLLQNLLVG
jgi:protein-tyrosine phosphatase